MDTLLMGSSLALIALFVFVALLFASEKMKELERAGTEQDEWLTVRLKRDLYWCNRGKR